ncbi:MAG: 2-C-methyl-D-erythritol 2,4-cyclodiphosphate synthase [Clostridiales Family XIII bacterium]|jgi:2-C-methyl-D-erythritol 2,4-cyclodiphosphate synthase/2-C-methyl-D-erythritol 4-phosphate cytidylyltransferase|nr:2-C-methyl-D-erythritol 2,4-cyclodiphosphate synthase [Clostridiales Family XIII bacterium]
MYKGRRIGVLIAAAGSGSRMGTDTPKQFIELGGQPMLRVTAGVFERNEAVDDIYIVAPAEYLEQSKDALAGLSKLRGVCGGGQTRQESVRLGLRYVKELSGDDVLLIHDAARPFLSGAVIKGVLEGVLETGAAVCCVPVKDTVYRADRADPNGQYSLCGVPPREELFAVQTPQGFDFALISEAHERAFADKVTATDDGSLAAQYGAKVLITSGSYDNIKITTVHDLPGGGLGSALSPGPALSPGSDPEAVPDDVRIGTGFDVHAFAAGRKLILGGVEIAYGRGLLGHSDADVLVHALMDAMLGALALGDIGTHFPDTDERYKDISSMKLLAEVVSMIGAEGYTVSNTDMTIVAERPRLSGIIPDIELNIAEALGVGRARVSVKATTTEGLGFTGTEQGIGAQAAVILRRIFK